MTQEDYCSEEIAKLLQEKGFKEPVTELNRLLCKEGEKPVLRITHQKAMKWLREEHKLTFIISPQWAEGDMRNPCRWYWEIRGLDDINIDVYNNPLCNTYEEAVEAALKYSLENLI